MLKLEKLEFTYLECQCYQAEHTLRFTLDPEDGELYTEVYLGHATDSFFRRMWIAIKYIFGWQSKYGAFDCTLLKVEDYSKLRALLEQSEKIQAGADNDK
jgi:hypothetical protein